MPDALALDGRSPDGIVALAAAGDPGAFQRLVENHHASMARVAYVICGDPEAARDAVQAAWSIAWRRLRSLRDPDRVGTWLVAIAANEARGALRNDRRRVRLLDLARASEARDDADPAGLIHVLDLRTALSRLGPDDRVLLALRFVAAMDSSEIASELGISASGVRSRLSRLIERLRQELER
jgi:RNA polymerase sigma-70 factor (ECF subfamily)